MGRGLRQGCSLSPLLFILAIDGLSFHTKKALAGGVISAMVLGRNIRIYHSFFVDDVLIMGMINRIAWLALFHIFSKFGNATRLYMNLQKSIILYGYSDLEDIAYI